MNERKCIYKNSLHVYRGRTLENDPKEIRAAAVDAQRMSDWLLSRERERSLGDEKTEHERPAGDAGRTQEREPERPPPPAPEVVGAAREEHVSALQIPDRPAAAMGAGAATPGAAAMSEELKGVLRDMGVAGYRAGYEASMDRLDTDPHQSARVHFPAAAGKEIRFVLERVHVDAYLRGMHDHQRGIDNEAVWKEASRVSREGILRVEAELKTALREIGAAGYDRGYGDAAEGRDKTPGWPRCGPADHGPGDAAEYLRSDAAARAYVRGFDDCLRGANRDDAAGRRLGVDYVREVTAIGEDQQAALRYCPLPGGAGAPERSPRAAAAGDRDRDAGPSR